MSMQSTFQTSTHQLPWWMILLEGIAALIIGLCFVISPGLTTLVFLQFLGFYWLFSGILSLVDIFLDHSLWGWKLCVGILGILSGLVVIRNPLWSTLLLPVIVVIMLGIQGLIQGVAKIVEAFQGAGLGAVALGVLNILFGILLLFSPLIAVRALPIVVGIFAILGGVAAIVAAFRVHSAPPPAAEPSPNL